MEPAREGYGENSRTTTQTPTMDTTIAAYLLAAFSILVWALLRTPPATNTGWSTLADDEVGDDEGTEELDGGSLIRGNRYKRVCGQVAKVVKAKMGLPSRTAANRLVAWELADKELTRMGVRAQHRARFITVAVALVFVPTTHDILAAEIGRSAEVADRELALNGNRTWTLFSWLLQGAQARSA